MFISLLIQAFAKKTSCCVMNPMNQIFPAVFLCTVDSVFFSDELRCLSLLRLKCIEKTELLLMNVCYHNYFLILSPTKHKNYYFIYFHPIISSKLTKLIE